MVVLVVIIGGIIFSCMALSLFPRTQRFYKKTGFPLMLVVSGALLGMLLQMTGPLPGIAIITAIVLFAVVRWKKLVGRGSHLFRHLFRCSEPDSL